VANLRSAQIRIVRASREINETVEFLPGGHNDKQTDIVTQ